MKRDTRDEWPPDVPVGTFDAVHSTMSDRPSVSGRIMFVCPNGRRCGVLLGPAFEARRTTEEPNVWAWDGNEECPTITPSINCVTEYEGRPAGCGWHGFITKGEFR